MRATTHKYSADHGLYSTDQDGDDEDILPYSLKKQLVDHANASLSYQTWQSVKGIRRRVEECEAQTRVSMRLPWSQTQVSAFTAWCLEKGLVASTIQQYLSKCKKLYRIQCMAWPDREPFLVRKVIQERKPQRLAMTPNILWILKTKLAKARMSLIKKRMIWAMATFLFVGSLQSGEALPVSPIPITNTHLGTWHGVQPDNGGLGRRVLKHLWSSGIAKPMTREVASLSNQCYLT